MCDFSWSEGGATLDKVPPHIRNALERAAALEPAEVSGPRNEEAESLRAEVARLREKCRSLEKREAALEAQVADAVLAGDVLDHVLGEREVGVLVDEVQADDAHAGRA